MIQVTDKKTPNVEDNSILIQEKFGAIPTPPNQLSSGVYYSWKGKWTDMWDKFITRAQALIDLNLSDYVPKTRTITINGDTKDLSADGSWTVSGGLVQSVSDTNTVDLTVDGLGDLTANVRHQDTATINLSEDASGLKADFASMNISQFTNDSNYAVNTDPITQFSAFTHFTEIFPGIGAGGTGAGVWELGNGWVLARNSSGAFATPQAAEVDRPGIVRHSISAINGYNQVRCGAIWVSSAPLVFKGHFRIQILSGGGQGFVISCGFSAGTLTAPTDAIRIFLTVANVLQVEVIKSSVSLVVNTGITVAIDTHYDIVITKADTTNECQFWVNGVNVYSLTNPADIATYVPQNLSMECHNSFLKTGGISARTFDTDFAYVTNNLPI